MQEPVERRRRKHLVARHGIVDHLVDPQRRRRHIHARLEPHRPQRRVDFERGEEFVEPEVLDGQAELDRSNVQAREKMASPDAGRPCGKRTSALRIHAPLVSVSMRERSIAGWKARSKFSSVWPADLKLQRPHLVGHQRRSRPPIVLLARAQVPDEHGELAHRRDRRDLVAAPGADAQKKGVQRARRPAQVS